MTAAINIFEIVREYRIPFEIDVPNAVTMAALEDGDRLTADPNAQKYDSIEALFEELDKDEA